MERGQRRSSADADFRIACSTIHTTDTAEYE
ncbi:MAG: hypothetical protein QOG23_1862 [Blastocatellia bacterium]|jgi:hypothetical protein|nr:hypothetical protein [Blastocatellia bacterium]